MVFPLIDEVYLIVDIFAQINIDLHYIFEIFCDYRDTNIVFIIDNDVQNLCC